MWCSPTARLWQPLAAAIVLGGMSVTVVMLTLPKTQTAGPGTMATPEELRQAREHSWAEAQRLLGAAAELKDEVMTIALPRRDLFLMLDGYAVPEAAGLEHRIHFFQCPCAKILVHGQFMLLEHEINDVIDALRKGGDIRVAGIAPAFIYDRPKVYVLRFEGGGQGEDLARAVSGALRWVGEARNERNPDFRIQD